jgi:hypothetical protein
MPSNNAPDANRKEPPPPPFQYDLRLEIGVKDVNETIPVVAIFRDLIRRMKSAADGNYLEALSATDKLYFENKEMTSEEFQRAFHVDKVEGKTTKVMLGFKIRTLTKLSEIKTRLINTYLKPHNLFLRTHVGGFENGVKTYSYGYLKYDHPDHPDLSALKQRFARHISDAWKNLDKDERKKWKAELPNLFYGTTGIMLPLSFSKERIVAESDIKPKIVTVGLVVSAPAKYGKFAKLLLDATLLNRKINNLIPFALGKEDSYGYYCMVAEQARLIEAHRNIPIAQVPIDASSIKGHMGQPLPAILNSNVLIQRVSYDPQQNKYHVSTTASKYKEVHQWIQQVIQENNFPYNPSIRPLQYGPSASYASVFRDAISVASGTVDDKPYIPAPTNPWKNRPPLDISYTPTDEAFPPLETKKPAPATASTMSETLDEDTIQSAISSAIKKLEDRHRADLEQLKLDFQSKLDAVERQMKDLGKQIAVQTYEALIKDDSPLVTKIEHEILRQDVSLIKTQLTTILGILQPSLSNQEPAPAPRPKVPLHPYHTPPHLHEDPTKRSRIHSSPIPMASLEDVYTQDFHDSSAASIPEEEMEGCEA